MAIYPFRCEICNRAWEELQPPLCEHTSVCPKCGVPGKRVWTSFKVYQSSYFTPGYDVGLGKHFETDHARNEYLKRERPNFTKVYSRPRGTPVKKA